MNNLKGSRRSDKALDSNHTRRNGDPHRDAPSPKRALLTVLRCLTCCRI